MSTITTDRIVFRKPSRRPGFVGLPRAEISIKQCADGRWMWAYSFATSLGGEGFSPFPKWGLFEDSRDAAVSAAVNKMIDRMRQRTWNDHPHVRELMKWVESVLDDLPPSLLGRTAPIHQLALF